MHAHACRYVQEREKAKVRERETNRENKCADHICLNVHVDVAVCT